MFQHNAFRSCYEDHHIVGQFAQNRQQFGDERIDSPENTVRIPTLRHLDINGWYSTPNAKYDGLSPRDYLRSKSWDEQMQVGLSAIKQYRSSMTRDMSETGADDLLIEIRSFVR
jgi:hypothetical protein